MLILRYQSINYCSTRRTINKKDIVLSLLTRSQLKTPFTPVRNGIKLCGIGFSIQTESQFTLRRHKVNTIGYDHAQWENLSRRMLLFAKLLPRCESDMNDAVFAAIYTIPVERRSQFACRIHFAPYTPL